jgi:hypothetical protein
MLWARGLGRRSRSAAELIGWLGLLVIGANPWLALYLLPALGAPLLLAGLRRRRTLPALGGAALLLANPLLLELPYLSLLTNEAVVISRFIPIGLLIGGAAAWAWDALAPPRPQWVRALSALVLAGLAGWGAWGQRDIVNPQTVLAGAADTQAISWAAEHTPPDARFLVDTAGWLGTGRGADGGWWLLPLAGRWVSAPPVIYDYGPAEYVRAVRARNQLVMSFKPGHEQQLYELIDREHITFVYLGPTPGPLSAAAFPAAAGFEKIYEHDGATIYAVRRPR